MEIESLRGYRYVFVDGIDDRNQVFGIDLSKFEGLVDAGGQTLTVEEKYWVYNTFVDFHAFANSMTEPGVYPSGIQLLRKWGDRIVHSASHSSPPVHLNEQIEQGSTFTNGEITLTLVGTTSIDGRRCGLVEVDSGDSSMKMNISPMPGMSVRVKGYSRYGAVCGEPTESLAGALLGEGDGGDEERHQRPECGSNGPGVHAGRAGD